MNTKSVPTLEKLRYFSRADIIAYVGINLLKQHEKSVISIDNRSKCAFRGDKGLKCAIGFLIEDDKYDRNFERFGAMGLVEFLSINTGGKDTMLAQLQMIHDGHSPTVWRDDLLELAHDYHCHDEVLKAFEEAGV